MKNAIYESSKYMDYTNVSGDDIESGQLVALETTNKSFIGIALEKIPNGGKGVLIVSDLVVEVPKAADSELLRGGAVAVGTAGNTVQAVTTAAKTISNAFVWEDAAAGAGTCKLALR